MVGVRCFIKRGKNEDKNMAPKKKSKVVEAYKARQKIESDGVWVELIVGSVKVLPMNSRNKPLANFLKKSKGKGFSELDFDAGVKLFADYLVIDWEGFDEEFSKERFIEICHELKEAGFADDIAGYVRDEELFNQAAAAKIAKN